MKERDWRCLTGFMRKTFSNLWNLLRRIVFYEVRELQVIRRCVGHFLRRSHLVWCDCSNSNILVISTSWMCRIDYSMNIKTSRIVSLLGLLIISMCWLRNTGWVTVMTVRLVKSDSSTRWCSLSSIRLAFRNVCVSDNHHQSEAVVNCEPHGISIWDEGLEH